MPRRLQRARLEDGLRLDLNWLVRKGFVRVGEWVGDRRIRWTLDRADKEPALGLLTADMEGNKGYLRLQIGNIDQVIRLAAYPRPFGGQQWYFICPVSQRRCSVVWRPAGASRFASASAWKRHAAYASQFQSPRDRAISAAQKIRTRLGGPEWAGLNGIDPPKPRGMRRSTYLELLEKSHDYQRLALGWLAKRLANRPFP